MNFHSRRVPGLTGTVLDNVVVGYRKDDLEWRESFAG